MEGFLKIKETFWKQYYFILTNDCLAFCQRKGEPIIGRFHLKISSMKSLPNKPLNIQLNNGFTDILLEAEDVREKMKWIAAFENKQEELLKYDTQEIYNLHNLEDIIWKDNLIPDEIKENLENKFVNSLAELWNLQASIDENLDNLSTLIKNTFIINILKKIEGSVANIKVTLITFKQHIEIKV
jgi:predicted transcriptional regulator